MRSETGEPTWVLGVDAGGSSVRAGLFGTGPAPLAATARRSVSGPPMLDVVADAATELLARDLPGRPAALGLVMPGVVDADAGVLRRSAELHVSDLDVAGPLAERLGLPVRIGHDVRVAAQAVRRSEAGVEDPVVVVAATRIAAVSFVGGAAVSGVFGQAGELGHVVVRPGGPECRCGNRGCLESVSGAGAIVRAYRERTGADATGADHVVARLTADPVAAAVWAEAVSAMADALLTVCALLAPGAILLAGGLSEAGATLTGPVEALMRERTRVVEVPPVMVSDLGSRAGMVGAAQLARDRLRTG